MEKKDLLKFIAERRAAGVTVKEIAHQLTVMGEKSARGRKFGEKTLYSIISKNKVAQNSLATVEKRPYVRKVPVEVMPERSSNKITVIIGTIDDVAELIGKL